MYTSNVLIKTIAMYLLYKFYTNVYIKCFNKNNRYVYVVQILHNFIH